MHARSSTVSHATARSRLLETGGSEGNERLTAAVAGILLILLAAEGVTLLRIDRLVSEHVFIGMLLIPIVVLKLGSTGYRMVSYYRGRRAYVEKGPPHPLMRYAVAPATVVSTLLLFGTGVALVLAGSHGGLLKLAHQASFFAWLGAMGLHVLGHVLKLPAVLARDWTSSGPASGRRLRLLLVAGALAGGIVLALVTLPLTHSWIHTAAFGGG